jgi:hypothetical protein
MSPEQPPSRGNPPPFELQQWFGQRFHDNDLSLTGLDRIAGPDGDRFRLLSATLTALGGKLEQRSIRHPDNQEWVLDYTVANGSGWSACLLHVPRSVLEGPTRDDFIRLEMAVRLIWDQERGGTKGGIGSILIISWKSRTIFYGLRRLKDGLRERDNIRIDLRQWDDIGVLEAMIAHDAKRPGEANLSELVANRSTGFDIAARMFFCLPPPQR